MTGLFIILFALAVIVAGAFFVQYDSLRKKENARLAEVESASAAAQKAAKELDVAKDELAKKKSEAAELREKLNDLRAKAHKQRESEKKQKSSVSTDLQDALDRARAELDEERSRVDVLGREAKGMQDEVGRLKETSKKLEDAYKSAQAALTRAQTETSTAPAATVTVVTPKDDDQLKARVDSLESQARELRRKLAAADEEVKKAKGASSTAKRQFLVAKSELDLFREKLVWSEKRVVELEKLAFDNKLALPEREASPQPKAPQLAPGILARESANTGGEGVVAGEADYVPESAAAEETPAESAPAEPPAEMAATGTTEAAADAGPQAVPPRRRAKSAEGEAKA